MNWLSVKERLPSNDGWVLVTNGRDVTFAYLVGDEGWILDRDDRNVGFIADRLTQWMPLLYTRVPGSDAPSSVEIH